MLTLFFENTPEGAVLIAVLLLIVWTTVWKGLALWKSARLSDKGWFIALIVLNTAGILEILYLFLISKRKSVSEKMEAELPESN